MPGFRIEKRMRRGGGGGNRLVIIILAADIIRGLSRRAVSGYTREINNGAALVSKRNGCRLYFAVLYIGEEAIY